MASREDDDLHGRSFRLAESIPSNYFLKLCDTEINDPSSLMSPSGLAIYNVQSTFNGTNYNSLIFTSAYESADGTLAKDYSGLIVIQNGTHKTTARDITITGGSGTTKSALIAFFETYTTETTGGSSGDSSGDSSDSGSSGDSSSEPSEIELPDLIVNEVESDAKLLQIAETESLEPNQIFFTKDYERLDDSAMGLPVGAIFSSAIPIIDARVHLLDGSLISQTGVYKEFATLIKNLVAAGQPISCTQSIFDNTVLNTGNCGKFVIDDTAGTIRLPKITTFIQGLSNISNIGSSLEAGLPNITGTDRAIASQSFGLSGAFYEKTLSGTGAFYQDISTDTSYTRTAFDASRSNPIYGNSSTVQPNATQFPYYIVLAGGYKLDVVLDIDNIIAEIGNKTSLDEVYPVGSIYLTMNEHGSPARIFGGTWERIDDRFLVGAGNLYTAGAIGGSKDAIVVSHSHTTVSAGGHTHTAQSAGSHTHGPGSLSGYYKMRDSDKGDGVWGAEAYYYSAHDTNSAAGAVVINSGSTSSAGAHTHTTDTQGAHTHTVNSSGSSGTGANMPPYLAVYIYQRVE